MSIDGEAVSGGAVGPGRVRPGPGGWLADGGLRALGLGLAQSLIRPMSPGLRYAIGDVLGLGGYYLFRDRARFARENYAVFEGAESAGRLARRAFRNYAGTLLDFLILDRLVADLKRRHGAIDLDPLHAALAGGLGAIVVTPHLGNWDLGAAATATGGTPVYAVANPFGPPAVDRVVRRGRERVGVRIIPSGPASARAALRVLRHNQVLCLACDIDQSGSGVEVDFLGSRVRMPAGPATLSMRTGAPVIPGFVRREGGTYRAALMPPLSRPLSDDLAGAVDQLTQSIASCFEAMIRVDPVQWFAFHSLLGMRAAG